MTDAGTTQHETTGHDPATGWTVAECAASSGEPESELRRLVELGLLTTTPSGALTPDALRRVELIRYARRRGITAEEIAEAGQEQGDVLGRFESMVAPRARPLTVDEAATASGLDIGLLNALRSIGGWDELDGIDEDDLEGLRLAAAALRAGLPEDALRQMARVFSDVMDRLADAEVRVVHDYVHEPMRAQGVSGDALQAAAGAIGASLQALIEPTMLFFHRRAWRTAYRDHLLRHVVERHLPPPERPGELQSTVLFVDLVGFTPLTAELGDGAAADVLERFAFVVRTATSRFGGRVVKQIGDAFMVVFAGPADAVRFGLAVCEAVLAESEFPAVHIGAHHGAVLFRDGDYVGATVNLAARVAEAGEAGTLLATSTVRDGAGDVVARFDSVGVRDLKGVPGPVELFAVTPR